MQGQDDHQHGGQGQADDQDTVMQPADAAIVLRRLMACYPSNTDEYRALTMAAGILRARYAV